jgi:DNA-binding NarL/FixJ family response regulator
MGSCLELSRAGAAGFLVKDTRAAELIQAVRVAASGEAPLSPAVTRRLIAEFALRTRSPRRLPRWTS